MKISKESMDIIMLEIEKAKKEQRKKLTARANELNRELDWTVKALQRLEGSDDLVFETNNIKLSISIYDVEG